MKPTTAVTDGEGRVVIDGIAGLYSVTLDGATATVDASAPGVREASVTVA